ncbi:hypothetical protein BV22DRAFT_1135091 [Leucogyrophana mollusca]|uniref:Uncharacterized protein n=1 Tax=Leucogyrophana mollusca TaxID=85980 RepID=A0ACB8AXX7_9AGAM|nr:hypothetical protein BV22DRAFT_1135091 [Leucogyrophana mollusca]
MYAFSLPPLFSPFLSSPPPTTPTDPPSPPPNFSPSASFSPVRRIHPPRAQLAPPEIIPLPRAPRKAPPRDAALVCIIEDAGSTTPSLASKFSKGGARGGRRGAGGEITPVFKRHLSAHPALLTALAHKWLGVDAWEGEHAGEAVGFLAWARRGLEELRGVALSGGISAPGGGGSRGWGKGKGKGGRGRKEVVQEELECVCAFGALYAD